MRLLPAFFIAAAVVLTGPAAWSAPLKIKLPHLVKAEEKICERKPDGVYCGRGIKRKHLFRCAGGEIDTSLECAFGCDQKAQACITRPARKGSLPPPARVDCNFTGQLRRAGQTTPDCR
jgi:hypothetical protein